MVPFHPDVLPMLYKACMIRLRPGLPLRLSHPWFSFSHSGPLCPSLKTPGRLLSQDFYNSFCLCWMLFPQIPHVPHHMARSSLSLSLSQISGRSSLKIQHKIMFPTPLLPSHPIHVSLLYFPTKHLSSPHIVYLSIYLSMCVCWLVPCL